MSQSLALIESSTEVKPNNKELLMRGAMCAVGFAFAIWFMGFWAWQAWELRRIANHFETFTVNIDETLPYFENKKK